MGAHLNCTFRAFTLVLQSNNQRPLWKKWNGKENSFGHTKTRMKLLSLILRVGRYAMHHFTDWLTALERSREKQFRAFLCRFCASYNNKPFVCSFCELLNDPQFYFSAHYTFCCMSIDVVLISGCKLTGETTAKRRSSKPPRYLADEGQISQITRRSQPSRIITKSYRASPLR